MSDLLRTPPTAPEAEAALLAILIGPWEGVYDRIADLVAADDFSDPLHRRIYAAIAAQAQAHRPHDSATLYGMLSEQPIETDEHGEVLTERGYLAQLAGTAVTAGPAEDYARLIADVADRRRLLATLDEARERVFQPSIDLVVPDIKAQVARDLEAIGDRAAADDVIAAEAGIDAAIAASEAAGRRDGLVGISTGFAQLDKYVHGLVAGQVTILAARPSMGKTALAGNIAVGAAKAGCKVGYFSLEMLAASMWQRWLAAETGTELDLLVKGQVTDWTRLVRARTELRNLPLWLVDRRGLTVERMHALARRQKRAQGLDLIVVDHMHLVEPEPGKRSYGKTQDMTDISKGLARMAGDLDVPVLALAQLNRSVESRDDKRPMLSDLRESGSIEQDADVVLFLYRQDYYLERAEPQKTDKMTPDQHSKRLLEWREHLESVRGEADVIIAKNRHGRIGTVKLAFQGEFSRFRDLQDADVAAERVARFEGI
mgnify:CR=1 FL=1